MEPAILGLGLLCLVMGLGLYIWLIISDRQPLFHTVNLIAWLLMALFPVLVIFSIFPNSQFNGTLNGASVGGAIGAFIFIWWYGTRSGLKAAALDRERQKTREVQQKLKAELKALERRNATEKTPRVLQGMNLHSFRVKGLSGKCIGIAAGNLRDLKGVDVWVNSENTNMQMASFFDRSVSGLIRYLGADRDSSNNVTKDRINLALAEKLGNAISVVPGTVLVTTSGELVKSHGVKAIFHVAAVRGQPGLGYTQVDDIGCCVQMVLSRIDSENLQREEALRSVVFPLMGVGQGRADLEKTVLALSTAAVDHLLDHRGSRVRNVYFLAYTDVELSACEAAFEDSDRLAKK
jgi:O-acetyl-ADP-ribose deacetylase (regulator of RNase III)